MQLLRLHKRDILHMSSHMDPGHISRLIPFGLAGHVVINQRSVDCQILKTDVLHRSLLVVARYLGDFGVAALIGDVAEEYILDAPSGSGTILFVVEDTDIDKLSLAEILHPDVLKTDVTDEVVVAGIDGEATLIIQLLFLVVQDVDIHVTQIFNRIPMIRIPMDAYHDGVYHICPQRGVLHGDVLAAAFITHSGGIDGRAVVRVATEHPVEQHMAAGKHIQPITPPV